MMLRIIVPLLLFHAILGQNLRGDKGNKERSHKKLNRLKLHYTGAGSTSIVHMGNKYGIDLPAFAFDYSEYFAGAIVERSRNSKDLFLTMQLVGHKSIMTDFPFHAISTDEEVLHSWSKAVNKWAVTPSISKVANRTATGHHGGGHSSGLVCLLQNNDDMHSTVYQSAAYWVHTYKDKDRDSSSANNAFAILRCKLRHSAHISNLTYSTPKEIFVDIMRINKRTSIHRNHTTKGKVHRVLAEASMHTVKPQNASTESNIAADTRGTVLTSFSVPWSTRVVGYPLKHHSNASMLDLWIENIALINTRQPTDNSLLFRSDGSSSTSTHSSSGNHTVVPLYPHTPSQHTTVLCVPGVRPLHPGRADVGLPMLLEFIEHHLLLGFSHIALGLALDWKSVYMTKHIEVLQPYIKAGQVSVHSTTLPGYDDVPGFGGIQLEDAYAAQFFLNQCLYLAKGMSAYVSVLHADEFIVPTSAVEDSSSGVKGSSPTAGVKSFVSALLTQLEQGSKLRQTLPSNSSSIRDSGSRGARISDTEASVCSFALRAAVSSTSAATTTAEYTPVDSLHVFGVEDPVNVFGAWGPGESNWAREFFATTTPRRLHPEASLPYSVPFLPTERVVRIDVSSTGVVQSYCRHHTSSGSSSNVVSTTTTADVSSGGSSTEPAVRAALLVYKGTFPSKLLMAPIQTNTTSSNTTAAAEAVLKTLLSQRAVLNTRIEANLKARGMSSIKEVKALVKNSKAKHLQLFPATTTAATGTNVPVKSLPTRADVKPPFWQLCNTDQLRDVIKRVFHTAV